MFIHPWICPHYNSATSIVLSGVRFNHLSRRHCRGFQRRFGRAESGGDLRPDVERGNHGNAEEVWEGRLLCGHRVALFKHEI